MKMRKALRNVKNLFNSITCREFAALPALAAKRFSALYASAGRAAKLITN